eukprot:176611_1
MNASNIPVCTHFQRGYCAFGNQCRYLHSRFSSYNTPPPNYYYHQENRYYSTINNDNYNNNYTQNNNYSTNINKWSINKDTNTNINNSNDYNNLNPNESSKYSTLFPTKREETMEYYIDHSKETIIFDIDGTIADIEKRLALSPGTKSDGSRKRSEWNIVLNGNNYKYDRVIPVAWAYLKYIESLNKYNILYLSGRRINSINDTINWLFNINKYPKGYVIHRFKGMSGQDFKQQQLIKLNNKLNIICYFGDRIIDDCICSIKAGIRPILVKPNEWLFRKHIYGGVKSVINDIINEHNYMIEKYKNDGKINILNQLQNRNIPNAFIDIAKNSQYWDMSYEDIIPMQYATELFDNNNMELLPPNVLLKCQQNENYWNQIMNESNKLLLLHNDISNDDNQYENKEVCIDENNNKQNDENVKKFIE